MMKNLLQKSLALSMMIFLGQEKIVGGTNNNPSLFFTENKGQISDQNYKPRPDVLFNGSAGDMNFFLKKTGISYQLFRVDEWKQADNGNKNEQLVASKETIYRVDLNWLGINSNAVVKTGEALSYFSNYYLPTCPEGALNVKSYTGITLGNLYNNIDLHYYEKNGALKYDYIVSPGADYKQIRIQIEGADVYVRENGSIQMNTPLGTLEDSAPIVFQNGRQLESKWVLKDNVLSFEVNNYDASQTMVIDPGVRVWGSYFDGNPGSAYTTLSGNHSDSNNDVITTGSIFNATNFATSGTHQTTFAGGNSDSFLFKFNSSGQKVWATFFGGNNDDIGTFVNIDNTNEIFIAGYTSSTVGIASGGAHQTAFGGGTYDNFFGRFTTNGVRVWSTYYGANGNEGNGSVALDNNGNPYFVATSSSSVGISTAGAHQVAMSGPNDAYMVKFNTAGVRQWATYYGGTLNEIGYSVRLDGNGDVYLGGKTSSSVAIATGSAFQTALSGTWDGMLIKFNPSGVRQWGTYFGGTGDEDVQSVTINGLGDIFIGGVTSSSTNISTGGAHQTALAGTSDGYISKFNLSGARQWSTYYGGTQAFSFNEQVNSLDSDPFGNVFFVGAFGGNGLATPGAFQLTPKAYNNSATAMMFGKFNGNGVRKWATFYADSGNCSFMNHCITYNSGNIYASGTFSMCGGTSGTLTSLGTFSVYQSTTLNMSGLRGVITKFNDTTYSTSGIINVQSSHGQMLDIYPNPNNGVFNINVVEDKTTIEVCNIVGQGLQRTELNSGIQSVDISHLPSGLYLLNVTAKDKRQTYKIIKE